MKRVRVHSWGGQLLQGRTASTPAIARTRMPFAGSIRCQSSALSASRDTSVDAAPAERAVRGPLPSPPPSRAAGSAKLAALHGRLSLSKKIPLETLARALVVSTADENPNFNNANLAYLGSTFINYHIMEYLVCKWPRLPMTILYEALRAYSGPMALHQIARRWGVESAAAPGEEVDPGLLQWLPKPLAKSRFGYVRAEDTRQHNYQARRGISSRVVLDNDFGDSMSDKNPSEELSYNAYQDDAYGSFAQAVVGAVYMHAGREAARDFVQSHILSRHLDLSKMFQFQLPTRELAMLCAREDISAPIARLESETGRKSRTPVYVVGVYSGSEKLGEGTGASLNTARWNACMNALKAWYLYSPGNKVRVPSDMLEERAQPWKAPYIDIGEII